MSAISTYKKMIKKVQYRKKEAVNSDVLAIISHMLSFSLFFSFFIRFHPEGIYVTSLTPQELEPTTSMPPVLAEGDNKHSDCCKITAGSRHRLSHQSRGNIHKKPVSIHPSNSCLRAGLQRHGTGRTRHSETPLPAIWQHNASLQITDI